MRCSAGISASRDVRKYRTIRGGAYVGFSVKNRCILRPFRACRILRLIFGRFFVRFVQKESSDYSVFCKLTLLTIALVYSTMYIAKENTS